jgi:RNA polymerase sigma factor (sigma-70 family)
MTGLSENEFLERFLTQRDEAAFEAILRRHGPMVLGVCRRLLSDPNDVEDAFQATFFVLVKKAGSIRDRDVLGTWLYSVARRVAMRARVDTRRRRAREWSDATEVACKDQRTEGEHPAELRAINDEELGRLAERYRSPLVLCDLEGHTHEQAAIQLRCPVGTVKSRLARARQKLRSRLTRRGLAPSAGLLAITLAPEPASAMTTELAGSTIEAATKLAAGRAVAGAISAVAAALAEGTLRSMSMTTLNSAAALLTAAGIIATGAGVLAYQAPGNQPAGAALDPRTKADLQTKRITDKLAESLPKPILADTNEEPGSDLYQVVSSLARLRYEMAQSSLDRALSEFLVARITVDTLRAKAMRVIEAHRDLSGAKDSQITVLENYLGVVKKAEERAKSTNNAADIADTQYYRTEAELWLAQSKAGREPSLPGSNPGGRLGSGTSGRPGSDPRSKALLARLEETIPMRFANPTPLEDVLKYIEQATAGPNKEGIPIYINPVGSDLDEDRKLTYEKLMKTPITMNLVGVPLRRSLKLLAEQLDMGYGIKDGMVTMTEPDMRRQNWQELMVMEESFPQSSPLELEVQRAKRGELTPAELHQLNERLTDIEEVVKRAQTIRMMQFNLSSQPGGMMRGTPSPPAGPQARPQ